MVGQPGFFDLSDRYAALSAAGDPLERLTAVVDFEVFRGPLIVALWRSDLGKGGRPPFDPVMMFKILVLQALYSLSDEATEFQIKDRLSFQRFLGLGLDGRVPDATTVWLFRERLVQAKAIDKLFARFDAALTDRGDAAKWQRATAGAKAFIGENVDAIAREAVQMHGGMGITDELAIGHALKRVLVLARLFGDVDTVLAEYALAA